MGIVRPFALLTLALCQLAAADDPLPGDWFYPDRPAGLVGLEGEPAPEITIDTWEGEALDEAGDATLASLKGKVVVLDFWATWCGPCVASIPKNIELVNDHKDEPFAFIGIHDAASGWGRAPAMIDEKGINYPVALDEKTQDPDSGRTTGASTIAYNVGFWPTYVVLDKHGIVRGAGLRPDKVKDAVARLLAEEGPALASNGGRAGGMGGASDEFPPAWYYGGRDRPASLRGTEGLAATPFVGDTWIGEPLDADDFEKRVTVAMFVSTGRVSERFLRLFERGAETLRKQGVIVLAVAAHDADPEVLAEREGTVPTLIDVGGDVAGDGGAIFDAYGIRLVPTVVVIDRVGTVRAAGVRVERINDVVQRLLSERLPTTPKTKKAGS